jgi:hypothetical protein
MGFAMLAWGSKDAPAPGFSFLAGRRVEVVKDRRASQKRHVKGRRARPERVLSSRRDAIVGVAGGQGRLLRLFES